MRNPVGLHADEVQVESHVVLGEAMALKNTVKAVQSAKVTVRSLVLQSLASAEATLTGDEREMGAVFVDIGGGTTDLMIYRQGSPWYSAVIPVGGDQLTKDLSVALRVPVYLAEETKLKWGHAMPDALAANEEVGHPQLPGTAPANLQEEENRRAVERPRLGIAQVNTFTGAAVRSAPTPPWWVGHYRRLRRAPGNTRVGQNDPGWTGAHRLSQRYCRTAYTSSQTRLFRRCGVAALGHQAPGREAPVPHRSADHLQAQTPVRKAQAGGVSGAGSPGGGVNAFPHLYGGLRAAGSMGCGLQTPCLQGRRVETERRGGIPSWGIVGQIKCHPMRRCELLAPATTGRISAVGRSFRGGYKQRP